MMKKILLPLLLVIAPFIQAGEISDKVLKEKKITIGTEGTFPPYSFRDEWGALTGFDIEVAKEIGNVLGWEVEFKEIEWRKMFSEFDVGDIHTIANQIAITPERQKKYDLTTGYVYYSEAVAVRDPEHEAHKDKKNVSPKNWDDLKGVSISIAKTHPLNSKLKEIGAKIIPNNSGGLMQSMKSLRSGKVEAVVNVDLAISEYIQKHANSGLKIAFVGDERTYSGFPFQKGEEELVQKFNEAIAKLKADGTLKKLSEHWFGKDNTN